MLKNLFQNNRNLKIISLAFGVLFWALFGTGNKTSITLDVPVCFYGSEHTNGIDAPEAVRVTLVGSRSDLCNLDINNLALHINTKHLKQGDNLVTPDAKKLFLPKTIKLVEWIPTNPIITVA